ncbi:hypothetical protein OF83DRAFT_1173179 [Amylostereum chailletii]|nr:hypothetical protein OF83DRAFT_1173179 [Amylostereum chailletii]
MEALRLARAEARQAKASSAAITPTSTNDVALPALVLGLTVSASALPNINAPPTLAGTAHRSLPHLVTMAPELLAQRGGSSTTPLTPLPLTSFEELRSDSPLTNTSPSLSPIPLPPHRETRAKASVNKRPYEDVAEDTNDAPKSKQAKNAPKTKTKTKAVATAKATKAAKAKEARAAKAAAAKVSTAAAKVKGTQ